MAITTLAVDARIDATAAKTGSQFPDGFGVFIGTNTSAPGPGSGHDVKNKNLPRVRAEPFASRTTVRPSSAFSEKPPAFSM
jgi:hypothetical protein